MIVTLANPYLAQNAGRRYPLADDTTGIPDNAILDFRCSVRGVPSGVSPYATLGTISKTTSACSVKINVRYPGQPDGSYLAAFTFSIPTSMSASSPYTAVATSWGSSVGELTVSSAILSVTAGYKGILFSTSTITVDTLKVDSIASLESVFTSPETPASERVVLSPVSGRVVLSQGKNTDPYLDGNRLRLDIYKGAGLGEYCQYQESGQNCENVLFSINGERPGSDGDIRLVGESGVRIVPRPDENAIEISLDKAATDKVTKQCEAAC